MRKDTTARAIPKSVKLAVEKRDATADTEYWPCCLICGRPAPPEAPWAFSCAHYISRAQEGLGVEENILTLCPECHHEYDQHGDRNGMREDFRKYLKSKYPDWDESKLIYRKDGYEK